MFSRCKITIANGSKMVEIVLLQPDGYLEQEGVTFFGKYTSAEGNIPPDRRGWGFVVASRELRLADTGDRDTGMVGGGLDFMETAPIPPFAILSQAGLTDRGIEPVIRNSTAAGQLKSGFALGVALNSGPVTWRLSGYKRAGSSAWVDPNPAP